MAYPAEYQHNDDGQEDGYLADLGADRRLVLRFVSLWEDLANGRPYPAIGDFTPDLVAPFKAHMVLIDLQAGVEQPIIRYVGSSIIDELGQSYVGAAPDEVPRRSILSRVTDHIYETIANAAPIGFEAEYRNADGREIPYRGLLSPLSRDGVVIDFIMAVINWRQEQSDVPDQAMPDQVVADQQAGADQVASEPLSGDEISAVISTAPARPVDGIDLSERLFELRDEAVLAGRSRLALYDLLVRIYGFAVIATMVPGLLAALFEKEGLRAANRSLRTGRSLYTGILKLVFGPDYDKTRLTEYAAALAYGVRQGLDEVGFRAALAAPGGVKAMVRAERQARRQDDQGTTTTDPEFSEPTRLPAITGIVDRSYADAMADLTLRAAIPDWRGDNKQDEPLIILARRNKAGLIEIFDVVEGCDSQVMNRATTWLAQDRNSS